MLKKEYESFMELRIDILWFVHNCQVVYPYKTAIQDAVQQLPTYLEEEISSLTTCKQCYENASKFPKTSFCMPCNTPHLLIWAKPPGYPFWPAKAMYERDGKIHVRFFEDHTIASLDPTNCYLYSVETPEKEKPTIETYQQAMDVSIFLFSSVLIF